MAIAPNDPYYTRAVRSQDLNPPPESEFSWDEFLGGLAKGFVGGAGVGINLSEARDKAQAQRLAALRANPDAADLEYDRRFPRLVSDNPITDPTAGTLSPARALDVMDTPTQGVNLMAAKEARDRQVASRRFVLDPELEKQMKSVKDAELRMIHEEGQRREQEIGAGDLKDVMLKYGRTVSIAKTALQEALDADEEYRQAKASGIPDLIETKAKALTTARNRVEDLRREIKQNEAIFEELGIPAREYNALGNAQSRASLINELLKKYKGTTRTRAPGSK